MRVRCAEAAHLEVREPHTRAQRCWVARQVRCLLLRSRARGGHEQRKLLAAASTRNAKPLLEEGEEVAVGLAVTQARWEQRPR